MFGKERKHKIFSGVVLLTAAVVFAGSVINVYEYGAVSFETVSGFGSVLLLVSFALIPEFAFLKLSEAFKLTMQNSREIFSERLLLIGVLLVVAGFIGRLAF